MDWLNLIFVKACVRFWKSLNDGDAQSINLKSEWKEACFGIPFAKKNPFGETLRWLDNCDCFYSFLFFDTTNNHSECNQIAFFNHRRKSILTHVILISKIWHRWPANPLDLFSYQQLVALRGAVLQLLEVMSKSSNISPSQSTYHGGVGGG